MDVKWRNFQRWTNNSFARAHECHYCHPYSICIYINETRLNIAILVANDCHARSIKRKWITQRIESQGTRVKTVISGRRYRIRTLFAKTRGNVRRVYTTSVRYLSSVRFSPSSPLQKQLRPIMRAKHKKVCFPPISLLFRTYVYVYYRSPSFLVEYRCHLYRW